MHSNPKISHLLSVCKTLHEHKIPFTLGGSGLLYFLGIVTSFNDLDLILYCSEDQAKNALSIFKQIPMNRTDPFTSDFFFQIILNETLKEPTQFDIIGHFGIQKDNISFRIPYSISKMEGIIPLGNLNDWLTAYEFMGRTDKVNLIQRALKEKSARNQRTTHART